MRQHGTLWDGYGQRTAPDRSPLSGSTAGQSLPAIGFRWCSLFPDKPGQSDFPLRRTAPDKPGQTILVPDDESSVFPDGLGHTPLGVSGCPERRGAVRLNGSFLVAAGRGGRRAAENHSLQNFEIGLHRGR